MAVSDRLQQLSSIKEAIKNALVGKGQTVSDDMTAYADAITAIAPKLQSKTVTPSTSAQTAKPDDGYDGLEKVTVNAVSTEAIVVTHSRQNQQVIKPSTGKFISQVTVPRAAGLTLLKVVQSTSTGESKTWTLGTTLDTPVQTSGGLSMMSTMFVVSIEDDDVCEPISLPFVAITREDGPDNVDVFPASGYSGLYIPSNSAGSNYFEAAVTLSVVSYAVTEEGVGAATIQVTVTTESKTAEFECFIYRVDKLTYF